MKKLSEIDRFKLQTTKEYLSRYLPAEENCRSLEGIDTAYARQQRTRSQAIMRDVERIIVLLDVSRGKTLIEKRFILGLSWRKINKDMDLSRDSCYKLYREAMIELYNRAVGVGMIGS